MSPLLSATTSYPRSSTTRKSPVASIAGLEAGWGFAYGVAKAGVIHMSKLSAAELGIDNIRVNAICPGFIVTPIFGASLGLSRERADATTHEFRDAAKKMQPLRQAGLPEDVAKAALYFASDDSHFVTGTRLVVDGGLTVGQRVSWDPTTPVPAHEPLARILTPAIEE